jgi:hypothetical protein
MNTSSRPSPHKPLQIHTLKGYPPPGVNGISVPSQQSQTPLIISSLSLNVGGEPNPLSTRAVERPRTTEPSGA